MTIIFSSKGYKAMKLKKKHCVRPISNLILKRLIILKRHHTARVPSFNELVYLY